MAKLIVVTRAELDCPGPGSHVNVYVRVASPIYWAAMGFKGVDCYLL